METDDLHINFVNIKIASSYEIRRRSGYQEGVPLIGLNPQLDLDFQRRNLLSPVFGFGGFRWEAIVRFVDIGGLVDYPCLYFLFVIKASSVNHFNLD